MATCGMQDCRNVLGAPHHITFFVTRVSHWVATPMHNPANTAKSKFACRINALHCGIVENTILQVRDAILQVWAK